MKTLFIKHEGTLYRKYGFLEWRQEIPIGVQKKTGIQWMPVVVAFWIVN